ncbi:MAG: flagellar basal body L-ring protein FlgH [Gammaproteobacteria bacterium]|nr:flagellar basal body L-ring protein FlgH [Gammaproteobacteria bacterium]
MWLLIRSAFISVLILSIGACASHGKKRFAATEFETVDRTPESKKNTLLNGAIYRQNSSISLFKDNKAYQVGDILTILLSERTNASTLASTSTSKNDQIDIGVSTLFGGAGNHRGLPVLDAGVKAKRGFSGNGDSSQSNSLKGDITVSVVQILNNGNLRVRGEKLIRINQGSESMHFSGVLRPQDIRSDNSISSIKVANAKIYYGSDGSIGDANTQGWLSRLLSSEYWFF